MKARLGEIADQITELEQTEFALYAELGKEVLPELEQDSAHAPLAAKINEVISERDGLRQEETSLNDEYQKQLESCTCLYCDYVNDVGSAFCAECGQKLGEIPPGYCTECGWKNSPDMNFCGKCGAPISAVSDTPAPTQPDSDQQPPPPQPVSPPLPPPLQETAQPPQSAPAMSEKQMVLFNAPGALNRPDQPWEVTIEGDSIVARWKWMDATFFAPHEINDETKQFTFTVTLTDKRTWKELDRTENKKSGLKMSGGKLSFGSSSNSFMGKTNQKSSQFGIGKNNQTGEAGIVGFKFNTTDVKQPVRDYLTNCGWKPAGLLG